MEFAKEKVGGEGAAAATEVRLMATAGLRLLEESVREAILVSCRNALRASGFRFEDSWAKVIPGSDEGVYAWVAANYALGTLGMTKWENTTNNFNSGKSIKRMNSLGGLLARDGVPGGGGIKISASDDDGVHDELGGIGHHNNVLLPDFSALTAISNAKVEAKRNCWHSSWSRTKWKSAAKHNLHSADGQAQIDGDQEAIIQDRTKSGDGGSAESTGKVDPQTSAWTKRVGNQPPDRATCPERVGALEQTIRGYADKLGDHVVERAIGLTFDSLCEAYDFYNLDPWEHGFDIRTPCPSKLGTLSAPLKLQDTLSK
ncbi:Nucleoside-diphosphatase mig-23 [Hordeum vulgare]|nr:Nucleoside-diphosphatase mig-23 [Hordeum vulgare]